MPGTIAMELSVIIPCFNAEATIATQLEALANQHWSRPWEVIVSDNGSTDNSMEIVKSYKDHLPNLRIVDSSDRRRQSHALNVGVRASAGKSLAFCDADDQVAPGWVAEIGEALSQYDAVHGQMCFDKFNSPEQAEHMSRLWKDGLYREQFLPHAGAGNIGVKRSAHEAIGGFDECLPRFADGDYSWRLQLEGYNLYYVPKAIYQYRMGRVTPSLTYLFRRGWTAPAADYWLYKKYRALGVTKDMILPPHRSFKRSLISWLCLLKNMPYACLRSRETRATWLQNFAGKTGEVVGQFQGRLMNPCKPYFPVGKNLVRIPLSCSKNQ
jgi:glycosyltransferase involved in cell wall biosynthesis